MRPPQIEGAALQSPLAIRDGEPASITVDVSGVPAPIVKWFLGTRELKSGSSRDFRLKDNGTQYSLIISKVTEELNKRGLSVLARNRVGEIQRKIELKVYKVLSRSRVLTRSDSLETFKSPDAMVMRKRRKMRLGRVGHHSVTSLDSLSMTSSQEVLRTDHGGLSSNDSLDAMFERRSREKARGKMANGARSISPIVAATQEATSPSSRSASLDHSRVRSPVQSPTSSGPSKPPRLISPLGPSSPTEKLPTKEAIIEKFRRQQQKSAAVPTTSVETDPGAPVLVGGRRRDASSGSRPQSLPQSLQMNAEYPVLYDPSRPKRSVADEATPSSSRPLTADDNVEVLEPPRPSSRLSDTDPFFIDDGYSTIGSDRGRSTAPSSGGDRNRSAAPPGVNDRSRSTERPVSAPPPQYYHSLDSSYRKSGSPFARSSTTPTSRSSFRNIGPLLSYSMSKNNKNSRPETETEKETASKVTNSSPPRTRTSIVQSTEFYSTMKNRRRIASMNKDESVDSLLYVDSGPSSISSSFEVESPFQDPFYRNSMIKSPAMENIAGFANWNLPSGKAPLATIDSPEISPEHTSGSTASPQSPFRPMDTSSPRQTGSPVLTTIYTNTVITRSYKPPAATPDSVKSDQSRHSDSGFVDLSNGPTPTTPVSEGFDSLATSPELDEVDAISPENASMYESNGRPRKSRDIPNLSPTFSNDYKSSIRSDVECEVPVAPSMEMDLPASLDRFNDSTDLEFSYITEPMPTPPELLDAINRAPDYDTVDSSKADIDGTRRKAPTRNTVHAHGSTNGKDPDVGNERNRKAGGPTNKEPSMNGETRNPKIQKRVSFSEIDTLITLSDEDDEGEVAEPPPKGRGYMARLGFIRNPPSGSKNTIDMGSGGKRPRDNKVSPAPTPDVSEKKVSPQPKEPILKPSKHVAPSGGEPDMGAESEDTFVSREEVQLGAQKPPPLKPQPRKISKLSNPPKSEVIDDDDTENGEKKPVVAPSHPNQEEQPILNPIGRDYSSHTIERVSESRGPYTRTKETVTHTLTETCVEYQINGMYTNHVLECLGAVLPDKEDTWVEPGEQPTEEQPEPEEPQDKSQPSENSPAFGLGGLVGKPSSGTSASAPPCPLHASESADVESAVEAKEVPTQYLVTSLEAESALSSVDSGVSVCQPRSEPSSVDKPTPVSTNTHPESLHGPSDSPSLPSDQDDVTREITTLDISLDYTDGANGEDESLPDGAITTNNEESDGLHTGSVYAGEGNLEYRSEHPTNSLSPVLAESASTTASLHTATNTPDPSTHSQTKNISEDPTTTRYFETKPPINVTHLEPSKPLDISDDAGMYETDMVEWLSCTVENCIPAQSDEATTSKPLHFTETVLKTTTTPSNTIVHSPKVVKKADVVAKNTGSNSLSMDDVIEVRQVKVDVPRQQLRLVSDQESEVNIISNKSVVSAETLHGEEELSTNEKINDQPPTLLEPSNNSETITEIPQIELVLVEPSESTQEREENLKNANERMQSLLSQLSAAHGVDISTDLDSSFEIWDYSENAAGKKSAPGTNPDTVSNKSDDSFEVVSTPSDSFELSNQSANLTNSSASPVSSDRMLDPLSQLSSVEIPTSPSIDSGHESEIMEFTIKDVELAHVVSEPKYTRSGVHKSLYTAAPMNTKTSVLSTTPIEPIAEVTEFTTTDIEHAMFVPDQSTLEPTDMPDTKSPEADSNTIRSRIGKLKQSLIGSVEIESPFSKASVKSVKETDITPPGSQSPVKEAVIETVKDPGTESQEVESPTKNSGIAFLKSMFPWKSKSKQFTDNANPGTRNKQKPLDSSDTSESDSDRKSGISLKPTSSARSPKKYRNPFTLDRSKYVERKKARAMQILQAQTDAKKQKSEDGDSLDVESDKSGTDKNEQSNENADKVSLRTSEDGGDDKEAGASTPVGGSTEKEVASTPIDGSTDNDEGASPVGGITGDITTSAIPQATLGVEIEAELVFDDGSKKGESATDVGSASYPLTSDEDALDASTMDGYIESVITQVYSEVQREYGFADDKTVEDFLKQAIEQVYASVQGQLSDVTSSEQQTPAETETETEAEIVDDFEDCDCSERYLSERTSSITSQPECTSHSQSQSQPTVHSNRPLTCYVKPATAPQPRDANNSNNSNDTGAADTSPQLNSKIDTKTDKQTNNLRIDSPLSFEEDDTDYCANLDAIDTKYSFEQLGDFEDIQSPDTDDMSSNPDFARNSILDATLLELENANNNISIAQSENVDSDQNDNINLGYMYIDQGLDSGPETDGVDMCVVQSLESGDYQQPGVYFVSSIHDKENPMEYDENLRDDISQMECDDYVHIEIPTATPTTLSTPTMESNASEALKLSIPSSPGKDKEGDSVKPVAPSDTNPSATPETAVKEDIVLAVDIVRSSSDPELYECDDAGVPVKSNNLNQDGELRHLADNEIINVPTSKSQKKSRIPTAVRGKAKPLSDVGLDHLRPVSKGPGRTGTFDLAFGFNQAISHHYNVKDSDSSDETSSEQETFKTTAQSSEIDIPISYEPTRTSSYRPSSAYSRTKPVSKHAPWHSVKKEASKPSPNSNRQLKPPSSVSKENTPPSEATPVDVAMNKPDILIHCPQKEKNAANDKDGDDAESLSKEVEQNHHWETVIYENKGNSSDANSSYTFPSGSSSNTLSANYYSTFIEDPYASDVLSDIEEESESEIDEDEDGEEDEEQGNDDSDGKKKSGVVKNPGCGAHGDQKGEITTQVYMALTSNPDLSEIPPPTTNINSKIDDEPGVPGTQKSSSSSDPVMMTDINSNESDNRIPSMISFSNTNSSNNKPKMSVQPFSAARHHNAPNSHHKQDTEPAHSHSFASSDFSEPAWTNNGAVGKPGFISRSLTNTTTTQGLNAQGHTPSLNESCDITEVVTSSLTGGDRFRSPESRIPRLVPYSSNNPVFNCDGKSTNSTPASTPQPKIKGRRSQKIIENMRSHRLSPTVERRITPPPTPTNELTESAYLDGSPRHFTLDGLVVERLDSANNLHATQGDSSGASRQGDGLAGATSTVSKKVEGDTAMATVVSKIGTLWKEVKRNQGSVLFLLAAMLGMQVVTYWLFGGGGGDENNDGPT